MFFVQSIRQLAHIPNAEYEQLQLIQPGLEECPEARLLFDIFHDESDQQFVLRQNVENVGAIAKIASTQS